MRVMEIIVMAAALAGPRSATPVSNPADWVTANDYPIAALKGRKEGTVGFRLEIDSDGIASACTISHSSGSAELDAATCRLVMARARFVPATDAAGRPTTGAYSSRVTWSTPSEGKVLSYRPTEIVHSYVVQPDGRITDCRLDKVEPPAPGMTMKPGPWPCALQSSATIFRDSAGRRVAKRVWMKRVGSKITEEVTDP